MALVTFGNSHRRKEDKSFRVEKIGNIQVFDRIAGPFYEFWDASLKCPDTQTSTNPRAHTKRTNESQITHLVPVIYLEVMYLSTKDFSMKWFYVYLVYS